jgi:hypothetical protein
MEVSMQSTRTVEGVALLEANVPERKAVVDAEAYVDLLFGAGTEEQIVEAPVVIAPAVHPRQSKYQEPGSLHG